MSYTTAQNARTKVFKAVAIGVAGAAIITLVLLAFSWPTKTLKVQNIPIAISGPAQVVEGFEKGVEQKFPGVFAFEQVSNRSQAEARIAKREDFGAILFVDSGVVTTVLTVPAANATVAQILTKIGQEIQAQTAERVAGNGGDPSKIIVKVEPVTDFASSDPAGSGLASSAFPLVLGGIVGGLIATFIVQRRREKLVFLAVFSISGAVFLAEVLQSWFGFLQGDFIANVAAIALSILGTSSLISGLANVIGRPGVALGAGFTMLIANPIAAATTPWQFIAQPFGQIGQYLVPGSTNFLLRSISYFPETAQAQQWITLSIWVLAGLVLVAIPGLRGGTSKEIQAAQLAN
jgi:uncharacterized membrane protein YeaQ/YmgE (transglycosylase-associated protein family)